MRYKDFDYLRLKQISSTKAVSINIVFITQLLSTSAQKEIRYEQFYDRILTLNRTLHHQQRILILDYEFNTHHHNHNMSSNHVDNHIDDRHDYDPEYGHDLLRNKPFYQVFEQWKSPWNITSSSAIATAELNKNNKRKPYLYTNIDVLQTTETFLFNDILIGIIAYNIHHNGIILYELKRWIHSQAKCLRKTGSDIIIVIGNGDYQFNEEILAASSHLISLILGMDHNKDHYRADDTSDEHPTTTTNVRSSHRIVQLPLYSLGTNQQGENYYAHINVTYHKNYFNISTMISEIVV